MSCKHHNACLFQMMTWWFTTFMAPAIKAKVHNLPGVEYLYSVMARDQLEVPAFVTEYDMTVRCSTNKNNFQLSHKVLSLVGFELATLSTVENDEVTTQTICVQSLLFIKIVCPIAKMVQ